jgi:tetratricopeptide (TPR) repeat protein
MGLLYEKSRDFGEAERWYQTALKTERTVRPAYIALARLLLATERRKQALDLLANATRSFPNDPLLEYMYGSELLDSTRESDPEQLERAESVLLKALELNPFYANTHYMLGRLYLKRGDDQTARIYFEKACAFNPKHTDAYYQWLRIAVQRGEKDKVAELSEIVRRLHDEEKKQIQGTVTGVVEESLRASPEGILLTRSTN